MSFQFGSDWNPWLVTLAALAVATFCGWTYWMVRSNVMSQRSLFSMLGFRLGAVAVVWMLMLQPTLVGKRSRHQDSVVAVLVDVSESMSVKDGPGGKMRLELVIENIGSEKDKESLLAQLQEKRDLRLFTFGKSLTSFKEAPTAAKDLKLEDDTLLGQSVRDALGSLRGQPVSGVVMFTDGRDLGDKDAVSVAGSFGWPVFTVGVGSTKTQVRPDIFIKRVTVTENAILNSVVPVEVVLGASGVENVVEKIELKLGKDMVKNETVEIKAGKEARAHFELRPQEVGTFFYTVQASTVPNEVVIENNAKNFKLIVTDKKIQVLLVDGKLRPEFKYLRRTLEDDQNVNVYSLTRSAEDKLYMQGQPPPGFAGGIPSSAGEMKLFDVVIFGDIGRKHFTPNQLQAVADYVDKGGGFMMLGGYDSFGAGGYAGTPIEKVLPVALAPSGQIELGFALQLTPEGQASPILQVDPNPLKSLELWQKFGGLSGLTVVGAPKPGATVLAVNAKRQPPAPVVVLQKYGQGKSMAIMADTTYGWVVNPVSRQARLHQKFWGQTIRALLPSAADEQTKKRLVLSTNKDEFVAGEPVEIRAMVTDEKANPLNDATVTIVVSAPDSKTFELVMKKTQAADGRYEATFQPRAKGVFNLNATAARKGANFGADKRSFEISGESREFLDTSRNDELLQNIAAATGGKFYEIGDAREIPKELKDTSRDVQQPYDVRLWDNPLPLILFLGFLAYEWIWRRNRNLR